jgi:histidine triad (HIT) family protein
MSDSCLFCRVAAGTIPARTVSESTEAIAFRDIDPKAPTHILVIPREHIASLADSPDPALLGRLLELAATVAQDEGLNERGYRVVINSGPDAGQSVSHLHLHVLGGRSMAWPPG